MTKMNFRTSHGRQLPVIFREEKRAISIPIIRLPPRRAPRAAGLEALPCWRPRKRFVFLNRLNPV